MFLLLLLYDSDCLVDYDSLSFLVVYDLRIHVGGCCLRLRDVFTVNTTTLMAYLLDYSLRILVDLPFYEYTCKAVFGDRGGPFCAGNAPRRASRVEGGGVEVATKSIGATANNFEAYLVGFGAGDTD